MESFLSIFDEFPEVQAAFSSRGDGDMKLKDALPESLENRKRYFEKIGINPVQVVGVLAIHGADVIRVGAREAGASMRRVDGLITSEPGVFLSVTAADCLALYFYDPVDAVVALTHAGWRGLARGVISKTLRQFSDPSRVRVAISPFIQACHFEVGEEVVEVFSAHPEALIERDSRRYMDLGVIAWRQLLEAGVKSEYTMISSDCTACLKDKYFSYRRDGNPLQVMTAVFGIKNKQ